LIDKLIILQQIMWPSIVIALANSWTHG